MIRAVLLALALLPLAAAAQMYKWVDEKGVTHYSETLPRTRRARRSTSSPRRVTSRPCPRTDWKRKELDARQQRILKEQNEQQQQAQEQNQARARHDNCLRPSAQLTVMQTTTPRLPRERQGREGLYR